MTWSIKRWDPSPAGPVDNRYIAPEATAGRRHIQQVTDCTQTGKGLGSKILFIILLKSKQVPWGRKPIRAGIAAN